MRESSDNGWRELAGSIPVGIFTTDPAGSCDYVNNEWCRLTGFTEAEAMGAGWAGALHRDDRERVLAEWSRATEEQRDFELEYRFERPDGSVSWVVGRGKQNFDGAGACTGYLGTVTDVTARRAAHESLREVEQRYEAMAANVPGMVYRLAVAPDGERSMLYASDGCRDIYGCEPEEMVADASLATRGVHPRDAEEQARSILESAAQLAPWDRHWRELRADGSVSWLHGVSRPHRAADGSTVWDGIVLDETNVREAQERLQLVIDNLAGSAVVLYDRELRLQFCEGPLFASSDVASMLGRPLPDFVTAEVYEELAPGIAGALAGESSTALFAGMPDRPMALTFAPYRLEDGRIEGALVHWQDISEQRLAEAARDRAEESFEVAFERAPIGMAIIGADRRFERVNDALCAMLGHSAHELIGKAAYSHVHRDDLDEVKRRFAAFENSAGGIEMELRAVHAGGHDLSVSAKAALIRTHDGESVHVLVQVQDITARLDYEDRLQYMADHDPLTGLLNRRGFESALNTQLARVRRYGSRGALLMLDLDGVKFVNDSLGHAVGDELITTCSAALRERLRETDIIARLGGDEFAVILPEETPAEARAVAQAVVDAVRELAAGLSGGLPGVVTVSIGVALFDDPHKTPAEMLVDADLAMYDAKDAGKDRFAMAGGPDQRVPRIRAQTTWLDRIRSALAEDRFVLHAQPIVDLRTRETVQHEVLVRMRGEDGELIPPGEFLHIAERFGLIVEIDQWVITRAVRAMAARKAMGGGLSLAVNVSGLSIGDPALLEAIRRELDAGGVCPTALTLELTETAAVADVPRARLFADALRAIGCRFALDDFGAGFGSFYYLKHLPFDVLKIDGEFVKNATANETDRLVIGAVSGIANGLGRQTVAEFVPDDATIALLLRHGVDLGQGYHLGRPAPLADLLDSSAGLPAGVVVLEGVQALVVVDELIAHIVGLGLGLDLDVVVALGPLAAQPEPHADVVGEADLVALCAGAQLEPFGVADMEGDRRDSHRAPL